MARVEGPSTESQALSDFARIMDARTALLPPLSGLPDRAEPGALRLSGNGGRLNLRQDDVKNGLARLVLALIKLLHELLERQAIERMAGGALTESEVERLGLTLMRQAEEIDRLRRAFDLEEEDLNIDLGPLGRLL